uniref:Gametotin binding protein 2 n=1 Tax=Papio anubis TaxID=9555 RepID=A0A8I5NIJ7_PAPAN
MRRIAGGLRVESRSEAGRDSGGSRRGSDASRSAAAAEERPGVSSSTSVPPSSSEVGGRRGPMARPGMERWRDRLALVTGASGGIGAAVARALVQQGLKVVGCARTVSNIEELAAECKSAGYPGTLIPYRCDLSNEEDILSMFSAIRSQHSGVDICINNAGLARPDTLLSGSTSGWKDMFNTKAQQGWLVAGTVGCPRAEDPQSSEIPITSCLEFPWDRPTLLVLGNEGSGLSQEVQASCQLLLTILPRRQLPPGFESLNVSVAAGILLHSICSQWKGFPTEGERRQLLQDPQEPSARSEGLSMAQHPGLSSGSEKERQNES